MKIKKCLKCFKYTLEDRCPDCSSPTAGVGPMRYSPQDRFGRYRLMAKKEAGMLD
ncbi:MAG: RNA-protein complex protein Nop10 [Thermoplasmata archaeon]